MESGEYCHGYAGGAWATPAPWKTMGNKALTRYLCRLGGCKQTSRYRYMTLVPVFASLEACPEDELPRDIGQKRCIVLGDPLNARKGRFLSLAGEKVSSHCIGGSWHSNESEVVKMGIPALAILPCAPITIVLHTRTCSVVKVPVQSWSASATT